MNTTNPAKAKSIEVTEKVIFPDATEQTTKVEEHGANKHTNVTREVFLSAGEARVAAGTLVTYASYAVAEGAADLDEPVAYFNMKVPDDFVSFGSVKAVWAAVGTGNMRWRLEAAYAAHGEGVVTHSDSPAHGETAIAVIATWYAQEPANPLILASLAAGDYIGIEVWRNGTHANDTIDTEVKLLGLLFTYTAEQ